MLDFFKTWLVVVGSATGLIAFTAMFLTGIDFAINRHREDFWMFVAAATWVSVIVYLVSHI